MKLQLKNISFSYNNATMVFDHHSISLNTEGGHGLYGIIGPSGTGKTTLISILGGQLRPEGEVLIDDTEIYSVPDAVRRELITMQLQTSTSLRGKLSYNLRFGLPRDREIYTDEELIETLERVGLWFLFKDKDGLDTLIGEGGLNLSGGQRQRLNFAGLYLRSLYYRPKLILVDEPTSSLDEISEKAITQMLHELSHNAVTLVVAHRLNTLNQATGILDSSLFKNKKNLTFLLPTELLIESRYFGDLQAGRKAFDNN